MRKRYIVQDVEGFDGIEFLADNPVGRRVYRGGEIIELDDSLHNVAGIMARGQIVEMVEDSPPQDEDE